METNPPSEEPNNLNQAPDTAQPNLGWWSVKSRVKLPVKVAELRRKLDLKAKQEPSGEVSEPTVHR